VEAVTVYHPVVPIVFAGLLVAATYGLLTKKPLPERWLSPLAYGTAALMIAIWVARLLHVFATATLVIDSPT
jgi:hypothetical protein